MKKFMMIAILFLIVISIPVLAGMYKMRSTEKCTARGCSEERYEDSPYCRYHKCGIYGCNSKRAPGGVLCPFHREQQDQGLHHFSIQEQELFLEQFQYQKKQLFLEQFQLQEKEVCFRQFLLWKNIFRSGRSRHRVLL